MKKFSALAISAALFISLGLNAQSPNTGLRLGAGINFGLDGVGADVVFQPYIPYIQIRGGYSFLPYSYKSQDFAVDKVEMLNNYRINGDVGITVKPNFDAFHLLVDLFPGANTNFHFTVGAYFNVKPNDGLIHIQTTNPIPLEHKDGETWSPAKNDFGNTGLMVKDSNGNEKYIITTDDQGYMHASLSMGGLRDDFNLPVFRPYFGIGVGRGLSANKRVAFLFDFGVIYCGKYSIDVNGYSPSSGELTTEAHLYNLAQEDAISIAQSVAPDKLEEIQPIIEKVYGILDKAPVAPVLKFNLLVRIF